jgi:hypothetical protein
MYKSVTWSCWIFKEDGWQTAPFDIFRKLTDECGLKIDVKVTCVGCFLNQMNCYDDVC